MDALTLEHGKVYDLFVREGEELKYRPDGKLMPDSAVVIQEAIDLWFCEEILNHFHRKLEAALKDLITIDQRMKVGFEAASDREKRIVYKEEDFLGGVLNIATCYGLQGVDFRIFLNAATNCETQGRSISILKIHSDWILGGWEGPTLLTC